ncbi:MAG: DNA-protecting protein DprA [Thermoleophilia bacterium]|nr:DNA-protecting protein DprA [Thermoleophilia bacterium]MDQ3858960.1 DNA-processing protein DprA [Actinomycetota bacterium]
MTTFTTVERARAGYPPLLAQLHDPPRRLYLRGRRTHILRETAVALVGARSCSPYGAQIARALARELAAAGLVVVSGLARGIDAEAHRGALDADGATIAVLGCGIDVDYPRRHAELVRRIVDRGLVVSEYPPGTEPAPWRFPARNRIIAGLCAATVVVEARARSGALITADLALELGRDVFAVPGEITASLSVGTNGLIRQGAAPLLSAEDVFVALGVEAKPAASAAPVSDVAAAVARLLADGPRPIDELVRAADRPAAEVAAALVELELAGLAHEADGVYRPAAAWTGR